MKKITRREFLKISAGIAAASALPSSLFNSLRAQPAEPVISVARGDNAKLVKAAVDALGGIGSFVTPGATVCIKVNISFAANIECGTTTSPDIVKQMVAQCLDAGAKEVTLYDHTIANAALCVEKSNITQAIIDNQRVTLLTPSTQQYFKEIPIPNGRELHSTRVAKILDATDVLINMPTAKSHSGTGVSLGLKNLMGLVWDRGALHRADLHRAIADLALIIKPDLTVIDVTRALVTGGPGGPGDTVRLDTVVAGTDPVAVDSYTVGITPWYGRSFAGSEVKHILAAAESGLGEIDTKHITIKEIDV